MKVAVVGATGLVGTKMLEILAERNFPLTELIPVASERSVGKEVVYKGKKFKVVSMTDAIAAQHRYRFIFAGGKYFTCNGLRNSRGRGSRLSIIPRHGEWILPNHW
jgi:aspartate-semialdehyde dehydrogenase